MTGGFLFRTALAATLIVIGLARPTQAVLVGSDHAGNYTTWTSGSNAGTGFDAWSFVGSGTHGYFLGSSTNIGGPGANINSGGGTSFGMFGEGGGGFADAGRNFSAPLTIGGTFTLDLAVNFRNGNKGVDLRNGSGSTIFNFNVGGDDYVVNAAATGNGSIGNSYSDNSAFRLTFTQTSLTGGAWRIARSGGVTDLDAGTYSGLAAGFKLYTAGTGGGSANNLMANNLVITAIPEASALLFGGLVCVVAGGQVWRKRRISAG
jgi:hypothetical protein